MTTGPGGRKDTIGMSTQMYLMGGLVESRVLSDRDLRQLRDVKAIRREQRRERREQRRHA